MEVFQKYKSFIGSSELKRFLDMTPKAFLAHIFFVVETKELNFGYYNPDDDMITTFFLKQDDNVESVPPAKALKKDDSPVLPLNMGTVKLDVNEASYIIENVRKQKYPNEKAFKKIFILQSLDIGQVWNVTYVTKTFKTLNVKIDASSGAVLKESLSSLVQFQ